MMNESLLPSLTFTETKRLGSLRFLMRLLVVSGCCNFVALLVGLYGCFLGNFWLPFHHVHGLSPMIEQGAPPSLKETLDHFPMLSLHQLVEYLADTRCVEEGYPVRALALSELVWHHHFDAARALQSPLVEPTMLSLYIRGQLCTVPLYLGLTVEDYDTLLAFGRREQWPITARAMFALLKDPKTANNPSLKDVFCLSTPFQGLHQSLLGSKPQEGQGHEVRLQEGWSLAFCLDCILERDWEHLMQCAQAVSKHAASTHLARQTFLAFYPPEKEITKELTRDLTPLLLPVQTVQTAQTVQQTVQAVQQPVRQPVLNPVKISQPIASANSPKEVARKERVEKVEKAGKLGQVEKVTVVKRAEASAPAKRSTRTPTATYLFQSSMWCGQGIRSGRLRKPFKST